MYIKRLYMKKICTGDSLPYACGNLTVRLKFFSQPNEKIEEINYIKYNNN